MAQPTEQLNLRYSPDTIDLIKSMATSRGMTVTALIRQLVESEAARERKRNEKSKIVAL